MSERTIQDTCPTAEKFLAEQIAHEPEYKDSWHDMTEYERDALSPMQEERLLVDPESERLWHDNIRKRMATHYAVCSHEQCQERRKAWLGHPDLAGYIKSSKTSEAES